VKFGEYLGAGVPVILEEGTGDMANMLNKHGIGYVVKLWEQPKQAFDAEVKKALDWLKENNSTVRNNTRMFVEECYTWQANVPKEREMYKRALDKASKK
jgi:glycosyltransferase involved in cell wall biosynthesis